MTTKEDISNFYDDYSQRQIRIGANERLISLYKRLLKLGLKTDCRVLELGCGVGIFTKLLSRKISKGIIEAVDLSEKSVNIGKKYLNKKNVVFKKDDVVHYKPQYSDFDFITLLDVIEHIPMEEHGNLFKNLGKIATEKTQILINIPNPQLIEYYRQHSPEELQVIDQAIYLFPLMQHIENENFEIVYFEKYSIWKIEDYHVMVLRKKRKFELKNRFDRKTILQKIKGRISRKYWNR
ncbi:MAG: class I SAM-dependent methyltransferase [Flavobacteriaceae bacterium]|jgi:2-polyprenyl-3-methyl-5-hydroxy-6-metoxy-1,4-benzoquinol methylase|nr:class I SAM-dependent methyltransferase [Flavobacteriaceae bacterium]